MKGIRKPIKVEYKTLVVIWLSLLISQPVFLGLVYFIKPALLTLDPNQPPLGAKPLITLAFAAASIAFFALSFALSKQHMRRAVRDHDAGCVQTGLVLGCALSEVPSVFGVLLAFITGYQFFFAWILFSFIGILLHFPRRGPLDAAFSSTDPSKN
jgi:hypothetical protein